MAKLTEYTEATRFDTNDILIKDGTNGTKKIKAANAAVEFAGLVSAVHHRSVYRGKNLGGSVTTAQKTAIQNGSFDDLFLGDYWAINGVNYRIADFDYWLHCGDTDFTKHHLVIVPDSSFGNKQMNSSNTTEGGYMGSEMYTTNLEEAKAKILAAFPGLVLTHREILTNAVTEGHPSGYEWADSQIELMNEIMVYGCHIYAPASDGVTIPVRYTINNSQLALFQHNPSMIKRRFNYWLRDVVSATNFAGVSDRGTADAYGASHTYLGVRPVFPIG